MLLNTRGQAVPEMAFEGTEKERGCRESIAARLTPGTIKQMVDFKFI